MKLTRLFLHRLPGFKHRGFKLNALSPKMNLVVGPNASGKTSICLAVQKLLWPQLNPSFLPCSIESEWEEGGTSFGMTIEDGIRTVSQGGEEILDKLPDPSMASCFSLSIDELFNGQDEVFGEKIAKEMSGGYDIERAEKNLSVVPNARSAFKEWKEGKSAFEEYKREERALTREKETLPFLEEAIERAQKGQERALELSKMIEAKSLLEKLHPFSPWLEVEVSEEEMDLQGERLRRITRLYSEQQHRLLPEVRKLEKVVDSYCALFGIQERGILETLCVQDLDLLEEVWQQREQTESKIAGIQEQISLYELEEHPLNEEEIRLGIDLNIQFLLCLSIPSWLRFTFLLPLWPLLYWFLDRPRQKMVDKYQALMGINPSLHELHRLLRQLSEIHQFKVGQGTRKRLEGRLEKEKEELRKYEQSLLEKGKNIGVPLFPSPSRYRFAGSIKLLYEEWIRLKKIEEELLENQRELMRERELWNRFASLFQEAGVHEIYDLESSYERIRKKGEGARKLREVLLHHPNLPSHSIEDLKIELSEEEKKGAELLDLYGKKQVLKKQLEQMEGALVGQKLLKEKEVQWEKLRKAAQGFAENELLSLLIQKTEAAFHRDSEPKVLELASEWFRRFTKNSFILQVSRGSLEYEAMETASHERKTLEQLSRGTRIQLLMAVRLAFALESETKGVKLPIFLDEVLANTDSERFEAVLDVLRELLNEGRQVFYFSCSAEQAYLWKLREEGVHLIDLGLIQREQPFLERGISFPLIPFKEVKKPTTSSLEQYAQELQISPMKLEEPVEMASSYYLADSVELLYQFYLSGLLTYGQIKAQKEGVLEKRFPEAIETIKKRRDLLELVYRLKKQGRGIPFSRAILEESGISKKRLEAVWELAEACGREGRQFIESLEKREDLRSKGLHQKTVEELKELLIERDHFDERPILDDDEVRLACFSLVDNEASRALLDQILLDVKLP